MTTMTPVTAAPETRQSVSLVAILNQRIAEEMRKVGTARCNGNCDLDTEIVDLCPACQSWYIIGELESELQAVQREAREATSPSRSGRACKATTLTGIQLAWQRGREAFLKRQAQNDTATLL